MAEDGKIRIEKFDGQDFGFWKMQIEDYLYQRRLHEALEESKPEKMKDDEWKLLDRQALGAVRLSLAKNVAYNIVNEKTTHGLIKALSNMYEKPSASNKVFLIRQLVNTKMKEGMSVTDHVNEFNSILTKLVSVDIKFEDEVQALLLLSSLPESWSGTVTAVSSSSGTTKLTFEGIRDLILGEGIRRLNAKESSRDLLHVEERGRSSNRKGRERSRTGKRGQSKTRNDITCWNCKENGHFKNQCPHPSADKDKKDMNVAEDYEDALVCCADCSVESWIMDSGASFHANSAKEIMQNFRRYRGKVRLADNRILDIMGIGDVVLKTSLGTDWTLKNVRYIPDLKRMLISVGQLDNEGHHVDFGDQKWKVKKGNLVIARGQKRGSLYMVEISEDGAEATVEEKGTSMKKKASRGRNLKNVTVSFVEPCVYGRQMRVTFKKQPTKVWRKKQVHTDVHIPNSSCSQRKSSGVDSGSSKKSVGISGCSGSKESRGSSTKSVEISGCSMIRKDRSWRRKNSKASGSSESGEKLVEDSLCSGSSGETSGSSGSSDNQEVEALASTGLLVN